MSGRRIGAALAIGVGVALLFDVLLRAALAAVSISPMSPHVFAAVSSKSVWLVAALFGGVAAPAVLAAARDPLGWVTAVEIAGRVLIAAPLVWTAARLVVLAVLTSVTGAWSIQGPVLLQSAFYADLFNSLGPWLLAGAALRAAARHLPGAET